VASLAENSIHSVSLEHPLPEALRNDRRSFLSSERNGPLGGILLIYCYSVIIYCGFKIARSIRTFRPIGGHWDRLHSGHAGGDQYRYGHGAFACGGDHSSFGQLWPHIVHGLFDIDRVFIKFKQKTDYFLGLPKDFKQGWTFFFAIGIVKPMKHFRKTVNKHLGEILVERGVISRAKLEEAWASRRKKISYSVKPSS